MTQNQMALHAANGCTKAKDSQQTGMNNSPNCTDGPGCSVLERNPNSVGAAFASAQGGVWATQLDVSGEFHAALLIKHDVDAHCRHLVGSYVTLGSSPTADRLSLPKHQHLVLEREWYIWGIKYLSNPPLQRANLPANLQNPGSTIDTTGWGTPSAAYPSSTCNITNYFTAQKVRRRMAAPLPPILMAPAARS